MRLFRGEPRGDVSAGRMARHHDAPEIERVIARDLAQRAERRGHVIERVRITAAGIPDAPVLDVPRGEAVGRQRFAQVPGIGEAVG